MVVVQEQNTVTGYSLAVPLARYAFLITYKEAAFFGVEKATNDEYAIREVWSKRERDSLAYYLKDAQDKIRAAAGYPMLPEWFTETKPYKQPIKSTWRKIIEPGIEATTSIQAGLAPAAKIADPMVFTVAVAFTDTQEVRCYYPGTTVEIDPSYLDITGVTLTIHIPRVRLVTETAQASVTETPRVGVQYDDLTNFLDDIDVSRVYNDDSVQGYVYTPDCGTLCTDTSHAACMYIRNAKIGTWRLTASTCLSCCRCPTKAQLNYRAGLNPTTPNAEQAIIRLAHSLMPTSPCGNDWTQQLWERDRKIPDVLDAKRLDCPFGTSSGAWAAWTFAGSLRIVRGGEL